MRAILFGFVFVGLAMATANAQLYTDDKSVLLDMLTNGQPLAGSQEFLFCVHLPHFCSAHSMSGFPAHWSASNVENACSWPEVKCSSLKVSADQVFDRVVSIYFYCQGGLIIRGPLPASIANFTQLQLLTISSCEVTGTLNSAIWALPELYYVNLVRNYISGTFPEVFGQKLFSIFLDRNRFYGTLPAALGKLPNLQSFKVGNNEFTCPLPLWFVQNITRNQNGVFYPNEFNNGSCEIHNNHFHLENNMVCGTIPFGRQNCVLFPFKSSLPSVSRIEGTGTFQSQALRVDVEGSSIAVFVKNRTQLVVDSNIIWEVKSYSQGYYQVAFERFLLPLVFETPTKASIVAKFVDGLEFKFLFTLSYHDEYESIKIGFEHFRFPPVRPPVHPTVNIHIAQFIKTPLNEFTQFECESIIGDVAAKMLDNNLADSEILTCTGSRANFSAVVTLFDPYIGPSISFGFATSNFKLSFVWALTAMVDGNLNTIRNDGASLYTENMIDANVLKALRSLGQPLPPVSPLDEQWLAIGLEFEFDSYVDSFLFDPDIRLVLFDLSDDAGVNTAAIVAGVLCAIAVLAAVVASLSIPSIRRRVYPFLTRKVEDNNRPSSVSLNQRSSNATDESQGTSSKWHASSAKSAQLRNTK